MYLQPTAIVDVQPNVTPQTIIANTLLQLSAEELEQAIQEALEKNPALDMAAPAVCPACNCPLVNGACPVCATRGRNATIRRDDDDGWWNEDTRWPSRNSSFDSDDDFDPINLVADESSLNEYLQMQAAPLLESDEEKHVAEFVVNSLDDKGFLSVKLEEIAESCGCSLRLAEAVLKKIQTLDPPGVAARSIQECLLLQLQSIRSKNGEARLARQIIQDHWDSFSRLSLNTLARNLRTSEEHVREIVEWIGRNLKPFPANVDWGGPGPRGRAQQLRPDIIVRRRRPPERGYEIEIPESRKYRLRINSLYQQVSQDIRSGRCKTTYGEREHLRAYLAQARLFINCVRQRWQTLERIALALVDIQEDFLEKGYRYLKPLTRSQLADIVGVHESTVGRAVASKSLMLPTGRIVPLSDFFDGSLAIKCMIEGIVLEEEQPLSDQKIAEILQEQGYKIARRTVAKYRDAIGIPPARVRAVLKDRGWKPLWIPPEHATSFR